jgi:two-component system, chemotaxis family, protein-glutamate methylesterase/glutaminase
MASQHSPVATQPDHAYLGDRRVDLLLIGGSAGVLDVLRLVLPSLSPTLPVPVVIVVHLPERSPELLPMVLKSATSLPLRFVEDKEPLLGGTIYFAPPGYHLLLESSHSAALSIDPPVWFSRPSIDVLFESAADAYAPRVLAVLLTGASTDGAAGLHAVHAAGGLTVVQTPHAAEAPIMPAAAIARFTPDYVLPPIDIARLAGALSREPGSLPPFSSNPASSAAARPPESIRNP